MMNTFGYIAMVVLFGFVAAYCAVQSVANFRARRYGFGSAGAVSALFALFWAVTMGWSVALTTGAAPSVVIVN